MLNARLNESISQSSPEAEVGAPLPTLQLPLLSNELRHSENWESSTVDGGFDPFPASSPPSSIPELSHTPCIDFSLLFHF